MKKYVLSLSFLCLNCFLSAQSTKTDLIEIGRQIPDITINLSDSSPLKLQNLKGKFVIFDFFSEGCIVCFNSMPKMKLLQEKFKHKLEFIMVGMPSRGIRNVYERFAERFNLKFRVAYDSLLYRELNKYGFPWYLWMDDKSVVNAITSIDFVDSANISKFIHGSFTGHFERELPERPNLKKPFLIGNNGGADSVFLFRSILFEWSEDMYRTSPQLIDRASAPNTIQGLKLSIENLYNLAYLGVDNWDFNHPFYGQIWVKPILELVDTTLKNKFYGYSLTVPREKFKKSFLQNALKTDLDRFFGLKVREEVRPMPCYKLIATDKARKALISTHKESKWEVTHVSAQWQSTPIKQIVAYLYHKTLRSRDILIDETGITSPVDLKFDAVFTDIESVNQGLASCGLQLIKSYKLMKVLIISNE